MVGWRLRRPRHRSRGRNEYPGGTGIRRNRAAGRGADILRDVLTISFLSANRS